MRNLFAFFIKHHVFLIFILLELIAVTTIVKSNHYQSSQYGNSSNAFAASIFKKLSDSKDYFSLRKINQQLAEENAQHRSKSSRQDTYERRLVIKPYQYIAAKAIKNSYNKRNNYLTINKGRLHGILPGMGVITDKGVLGIVKDVTSHYANVMSVLNKKTVISSRFSNSQHFGELHWDGKSHLFAQLHSIEKYVSVAVGDSLVTNSYSNIFPEGITIGTVNRFTLSEGANFYDIEVDLSVEFDDINYVYVVKNLLKEEREKLELLQNE